MIDARTWTPPPPDEIRDMIHGLRDGRSLDDTVVDVAARLGRSTRLVYYWMSGRRIDYVDWLALRALCEERSRKDTGK